MANITQDLVLSALGKVIEPELHQDLVTLKMIKDLKVEGNNVSFTLMLTTPACPLKDVITAQARNALEALPGIGEIDIKLDANVPRDARMIETMDIGVKNAIAIASGKGGVGKSTTAVNIAVSLSQSGAKIGLLDADIYGPNIPMMMGSLERPKALNGRILPVETYGIKMMSMGFLVDPQAPVIWRGPMVHQAIRQFLQDVDWGELDYMIIDLPPGTGDASLSLAQSISLTGAVIVTTPQNVALADVIRGIGMFNELKVPVLGVVENMSYFICPHCHERSEIFSHGGGRRTAEKLGINFLGEVPLDTTVRTGGDEGRPVVASMPEAPASVAYNEISRRIAAAVSVMHMTAGEEPAPNTESKLNIIR